MRQGEEDWGADPDRDADHSFNVGRGLLKKGAHGLEQAPGCSLHRGAARGGITDYSGVDVLLKCVRITRRRSLDAGPNLASASIYCRLIGRVLFVSMILFAALTGAGVQEAISKEATPADAGWLPV